ncbi:hypothetical protein D3C72_2306160 [compost metagenome]
MHLNAIQAAGAGDLQRAGQQPDDKVELDRDTRTAVERGALQVSGAGLHGVPLRDLSVHEDVLPRHEDIVHHENGVVLVQAR